MAKAFTEKEKEFIKKKLMEKGKELFGIHGLKKTNIEDITKATGISKGAFYNFFGSKEEFFFEIVKEFENEYKLIFMEYLEKYDKEPKKALKEFMNYIIHSVENNPFIEMIFSMGELDQLYMRLPEDRLRKHVNIDDAFTENIFNKLQSSGIIINEDPKVVSGLFRIIFYVLFHRNEIGIDVYQRVFELLTDIVFDKFIKD